MSDYIPIGEAAHGGTRPGRANCECQFEHATDRGYCPRLGSMHNGMFMCGPCWRGRHHRVATFEGHDPITETVR